MDLEEEETDITKPLRERLYGALWKLMEYEDTGLTPEEVEKVDAFDQSQSGKLLKELNEEQRKHRWIPVAEGLPEDGSQLRRGCRRIMDISCCRLKISLFRQLADTKQMTRAERFTWEMKKILA